MALIAFFNAGCARRTFAILSSVESAIYPSITAATTSVASHRRQDRCKSHPDHNVETDERGYIYIVDRATPACISGIDRTRARRVACHDWVNDA